MGASWTVGALAHAEYASLSPDERAGAAERLHETRARYRRVLESSPRHARVLAALGETYLLEECGDAAPGIAAFERALERRPLDPDIRLNLAVLLLRAGRADEARAHLLYVTNAFPNSPCARRAEDLLEGL